MSDGRMAALLGELEPMSTEGKKARVRTTQWPKEADVRVQTPWSEGWRGIFLIPILRFLRRIGTSELGWSAMAEGPSGTDGTIPERQGIRHDDAVR